MAVLPGWGRVKVTYCTALKKLNGLAMTCIRKDSKGTAEEVSRKTKQNPYFAL